MVRSETDVGAHGTVVTITAAAMRVLDAIRPAGVYTEQKVFGVPESRLTRRVKAVGLSDCKNFSGHSGLAGQHGPNGAPTHEIERQGRWKQGGGMVGRYTRGETAGSALRYL